MDILETKCLKINKNWVPIQVISVKKAFLDACAGAVTFLKFTKEGYPTIYRLDDWLNLEVADGEDYVATSRMHGIKRIAIPRVVICLHYDKLLAKEQKFNLKALAKHYNETCAVSGKKLSPEEWSREHRQPLSKGGGHGWTNEVLMDKKLNSKRGNKSYRKVGLKAPKVKAAPKPLLPINTIVNKYGYPEWDMFNIPRVESNSYSEE